MDIYSNAALYNALHKNYNADNNFIVSIAKNTGGPVLELAAGTGRLAGGILDLGFEYTGIDINKNFIEVAKKTHTKNANFICSDMRSFKTNKKYKFIFIGFNSFLHLYKNKDAILCLRSVKKHMMYDSVFLLSIFMPNPSFLYRSKNKLYPATNIFDFNGEKCQFMEKNKYNPNTRVNHLKWYLKKNNKIQKEEYNFDLRMYYPHEMDIIFDKAGLIIKEKYGDYNFSPLTDDSSLQIYVCKKG